MKRSCLIILACIQLHGCTVYRKTDIPLDVAAQEMTQVKVETREGQTWRLIYIVKREDGYYGVRKVSREKVFIPFLKEDIKAVYPANKWLSSSLTRLFIAIPVCILSFEYLNNNVDYTR